MIWIISGPTSAGKSTFISSPRCAELTGLAQGTPVVWSSNVNDLDEIASTNALFHYNILRSPELKSLSRRHERSMTGNTGADKLSGFKFDRHVPWEKVAKSPLPKKAVVLIASKETLAQRMGQMRPSRENPELKGRDEKLFAPQVAQSLGGGRSRRALWRMAAGVTE